MDLIVDILKSDGNLHMKVGLTMSLLTYGLLIIRNMAKTAVIEEETTMVYNPNRNYFD